MRTSTVAAVVAALIITGAAAAAAWSSVHVWTSHGTMINVIRRLTPGTYRLVYSAKNPKTQLNVYCGSTLPSQSHPVTSTPRTLTFGSAGCTLHAFMLGYLTRNPAGMFMRLELDRR